MNGLTAPSVPRFDHGSEYKGDAVKKSVGWWWRGLTITASLPRSFVSNVVSIGGIYLLHT